MRALHVSATTSCRDYSGCSGSHVLSLRLQRFTATARNSARTPRFIACLVAAVHATPFTYCRAQCFLLCRICRSLESQPRLTPSASKLGHHIRSLQVRVGLEMCQPKAKSEGPTSRNAEEVSKRSTVPLRRHATRGDTGEEVSSRGDGAYLVVVDKYSAVELAEGPLPQLLLDDHEGEHVVSPPEPHPRPAL